MYSVPWNAYKEHYSPHHAAKTTHRLHERSPAEDDTRRASASTASGAIAACAHSGASRRKRGMRRAARRCAHGPPALQTRNKGGSLGDVRKH